MRAQSRLSDWYRLALMVNNGDNYLQTIHGQFSSRQIRGSNLYSTHTETIDELLSRLTNIQKYGHID